MPEQQSYFGGEHRSFPEACERHWAKLCDSFLPLISKDSIWRYSCQQTEDDPAQGWKLHVSATVLTASRVLEAVALLLRRRKILYKAPISLDELDKLNSGLYYGFSQVGKFLTIYPRTTDEAVLLARQLHRLTRGMTAPSVPFDLRYRPQSCVYYRYGAFKNMEIEDIDGTRISALQDLAGNLVPDLRESTAKPVWVSDPFLPKRAPRSPAAAVITPLSTTFRAFRALSQRGKGGVYQAVDLSVLPPRLCVLKEGRQNGEVGWDGRDGFWRVEHEGRVLASLLAAGVDVPRLYSSFPAENNYYLAIEFIEGKSLEMWLCGKHRRLSLARSLRYAADLAALIARIHAAGWVWRDCKPRNIILTPDDRLRPLDFEGACRVDQPDTMPWGTPSYIPPEWSAEFAGQSRLPEDLYALGAIIYLLLVGCPPDAAPSLPLEKLRRNVPREARNVVAELLDPDPRRRPHAKAVERRLKAALSSMDISRTRHPVHQISERAKDLRPKVHAAREVCKSEV